MDHVHECERRLLEGIRLVTGANDRKPDRHDTPQRDANAKPERRWVLPTPQPWLPGSSQALPRWGTSTSPSGLNPSRMVDPRRGGRNHTGNRQSGQ